MIEERMEQSPLDEVFTDMSVGRINRNDKMTAAWITTNPCLQCPCLICHVKKKNGEYCSCPQSYLNNKNNLRKLLEYLDDTRAIDMHVTINSMLKELEASQ
jgi:hypothetical protein